MIFVIRLIRYYRLWRNPGMVSRRTAFRNAFKSERIMREGSSYWYAIR
jgi:hypothetical protein